MRRVSRAGVTAAVAALILAACSAGPGPQAAGPGTTESEAAPSTGATPGIPDPSTSSTDPTQPGTTATDTPPAATTPGDPGTGAPAEGEEGTPPMAGDEPAPHLTPLPKTEVEPVPDRTFDNADDPAITPDEGTPRPVDQPREPIGAFEESTRQPQQIPPGLQPYQSGHVSPVPFGRVDTTGVRVFKADWDKQIYDHPIAQAQYALSALESYRLTQDPEFLEVAELNAERIIERKHVLDGAWYFPYDFDFDLFRNGRGVLTAPWASGMASGQALSTFVRLHEVTGEERWRAAADRTFAAFGQAPDGEGYFSSFVDEDGLLWLEEYSRYPVMDSERVLNGHMWSMYGIWDYWMMNDYDQPEAERLFRGALYTVERTAMADFRNPDWSSDYSLWQGQLGITYHQYHQQQFLMLYRMSHDSVWIERASAYRSDFPEWRTTSGQAILTPETTVAYRLDDTATHIKDRSMEILDEREVELTRRTGAPYDRRGKIPGGPHVIRLSEGWLKGWWVEEKPGQAWSQQPVEEHRYAPEAHLVVQEPLEVTIFSFDTAGNETHARTVQLEPGTRYATDRSAIIGGQASAHLTNGEYAGWWLPEQPDVRVDRLPGWRVD